MIRRRKRKEQKTSNILTTEALFRITEKDNAINLTLTIVKVSFIFYSVVENSAHFSEEAF